MTRPSSRDLLRFFLWLGTTGFGGPIALVGYMEHEFVDRRRWVTRQELSDGLAFSQLAPSRDCKKLTFVASRGPDYSTSR